MRKTKIVVADDHPIVRMGVRDMLERNERFVVAGEASNSSELVALCLETDPHIAIIDYNMPGDARFGDGLKLVGYLLRHFPRTRVLIFTMVNNSLILSSLYDLGVAGIVLKSGDLDELLRAIDEVLQGRVYRAAAELNDVDVFEDDGGADLDGRVARLSPKESEVLRLFVSGHSVRDISDVLKRSIKTVSAQKMAAMRKLEVDNDHALLTFCVKANLFQ
ncbi:response regulator [Stutzerimonas stutzeri]|uniref:Response regulator n=1 Tax=Stutzerimonas stutzeri TaxID=316 RepID=A0A6I6LCJ4_STUST|nr:response regulator [Stutzerimonas stutzeri]QGZ28609.1 response regulator [Stutzerimonas stutzeri]